MDSLQTLHVEIPEHLTVPPTTHGGDQAPRSPAAVYRSAYGAARSAGHRFWYRLSGKGRKRVPGWAESVGNILKSSYLNILFAVVPVAWISHYLKWNSAVVFVLCFLSIIPMEGMLDWGGEQMTLYLGKQFGDLLIITLNNAVEAVLAIALLFQCELRLLQATLVGVILLHLLLIPGTSFMVNGKEIQHQVLQSHHSGLNQSLLLMGVLATLLPTAFFAALDRGNNPTPVFVNEELSVAVVSDFTRGEILKISRGLAILLILVYIQSRKYLHNPTGKKSDALALHEDEHDALKEHELRLLEEEPLTNPWACLVMLLVVVALLSATAGLLVKSIESVREGSNITTEWFGLILLPVVSYSADGTVTVVFWLERRIRSHKKKQHIEPSILAEGRAIDLSIQFTLWWTPLVVLLGWFTGRPMHLLFDYFEVAILVGSCFLVNYVTADSKTNWAEGFIMIVFYVMIALTAWFYPGQPEIKLMLECTATGVTELLTAAAASGAATEAASEVARSFARTVLG
ncbi:uncharacterized protein BXZ73DRAFT_43395 [Epithele typhae]|uniref:uncharacterized protein n=1 Tax=Epithele typhae TaxID=378194 RepID=UPI002007E723|nr:uncharacterized protein BXZ73DRAFT_43395 [Epithele typhae]KAH9939646.1 hypothetical protein BXZ73DRAFT_43395 [Epithele typhae]